MTTAFFAMALPAAAQDLGGGDPTPDFEQIETLPAWRWSDVAVYHTDLGITDQGATMLNGLAGAAMLVSSLMWRVLLWATKFATIDVIGENAGAINGAFNSVAKPLVDARLHQIGLLAGFGWAVAKASKSLNMAAGMREGARVLLPYAVLVALMTNTAGASPTGPQPKLSLGGMMASADDKLGEFATLPSQIVADQSLFNNNANDDVCSGYRSWMHDQFAAANEGNPMAGIPQAVSSMWEVGYYELWTQAQVGEAAAADRAGCHLADMQAKVPKADQRTAFRFGGKVSTLGNDTDDYFAAYNITSTEYRRTAWAWIACDPISGSVGHQGAQRIALSPDWEGISADKPGLKDRIPSIPGLGNIPGTDINVTETVVGVIDTATSGGINGGDEDGEQPLTDAACETFLASGISSESDAAELFDFHRETFEKATDGEGPAYEAMTGFVGYKGGQRVVFSFFAVAFATLMLVSAGGLVMGILFAQILGIAIAALLALLLVAFMIPGERTTQARKKIISLLIYAVAGKYLMVLAFSVFVLIANTFDSVAGDIAGSEGLDRAMVSGMMLFLSWFATKKLFETFDLKVGGLKTTVATVTGLSAAGIVAANSRQGSMRRMMMREQFMMQSRMTAKISPTRRLMGGRNKGRRSAGFNGGPSPKEQRRQPAMAGGGAQEAGDPPTEGREPGPGDDGSGPRGGSPRGGGGGRGPKGGSGGGGGGRGPKGGSGGSGSGGSGAKRTGDNLGVLSAVGAAGSAAPAPPTSQSTRTGSGRTRRRGQSRQRVKKAWTSVKSGGPKTAMSKRWTRIAGEPTLPRRTKAANVGRTVGKSVSTAGKSVSTFTKKHPTATTRVTAAAVAPLAFASFPAVAVGGAAFYAGRKAYRSAGSRRATSEPPPIVGPPVPTQPQQEPQKPAEPVVDIRDPRPSKPPTQRTRPRHGSHRMSRTARHGGGTRVGKTRS